MNEHCVRQTVKIVNSAGNINHQQKILHENFPVLHDQDVLPWPKMIGWQGFNNGQMANKS